MMQTTCLMREEGHLGGAVHHGGHRPPSVVNPIN
jgi:hypothetical protein